MAPQRMNENATPFGKWLEKHGIEYAEAARELGITRERVRQLAQRLYPSLVLVFVIEDWTRSVDPEDVIDAPKWREVVRLSSDAKEEIDRPKKKREETAPAATRPRKSRLRR